MTSGQIQIVILLGLLTPAALALGAGQPATAPSGQAAEDVPKWASKCLDELLQARVGGELRPTDVSPRDDLYALDAEVDLLAAAALALEDPDGVLAIYRTWYRSADDALRTPIAPILKARAFRLRAWQRFDPPPERAALLPVPDRLKAFEGANSDLAQASNLLDAQLGSIYPGAAVVKGAKAENLTAWIQRGLPKPTFAGGGAQSVKFPVFQAVDFVREYLSVRALIFREIGDLIFRDTGSAIEASDRQGQATALAYYGLSRDLVFTNRLMFSTDRFLQSEGKQVAKRIEWVRSGRMFGGEDFFQFEPYDQRTYITHSLSRLKDQLRALEVLDQSNANLRAGQTQWLQNLVERQASRAMLEQTFNAQAARELTSALLEVRSKLHNLKSGEVNSDVQRAEVALSEFVAERGVSLQAASYKGELRRVRESLLQDLVRQIDELTRHGGVHPNGELGGILESEEIKSLADWITSLRKSDGSDPLGALAAQSWNQLSQKGTDALQPTTIGRLAAKWRIAEIEHDRQLSLRQIEELDEQAVAIQGQEIEISKILKEQQEKLDQVWAEFDRKKDKALRDQKLEAIQNTVIPRLRSLVTTTAGRLQKAREYVEKFAAALTRLRALVDNVRNAKRMVDSAYNGLVKAVEQAKALPAVISGTLSGTMTDPGKALASGAESLARQIEAFYQGTVDVVQLETQLQSAIDKANGYLQEADKLAAELEGVEAKLKENIGIDQLAQTFKPGGDIFKQYQQREAELRQAVAATSDGLSTKRHELDLTQDQVKTLKREDRNRTIEQARLGAAAARVELDQAILERDHRVAQLLATRTRLVNLSAETNALNDLNDLYGEGLREKKAGLQQTLVGRSKLKADEIAHEQELERALALFRSELARLRSPKNRMVIKDLLDSVAPAIALGHNRVPPAEKQALLDGANLELLRCARWLYILNGDRGAIGVAAPCRSTVELHMAVSEVEHRWARLRHDFSGTQHKVVVLTFNAQQLQGAQRTDRIVFRTSAEFAPMGLPAVGPRAARDILADPKLFDDRTIWEYEPVMMKGVPTFFLSQSALETRGIGCVHGVWALPEWTDQNGAAVNGANFPPLTTVALERVGPFHTRWPGREPSILVKSDEFFGRNPVVFGDFCRIGNVQRFFAGLHPADDRLLEEPYQGQPNAQFFGLGLDGTWVLTASAVDQWGRSAATPLQHLGRLRILFTYLAPTTAISMRERGTASHLNLTILRRGLGPATRPSEQEEAAFWGPDLWRTHSSQRNARLDQIDMDLAGQRQMDDLGVSRQVAEELDAVFAGKSTRRVDDPMEPSLQILQPVEVGASLAKVRAILSKLVDALKSDSIDPLERATTVLTRVHPAEPRFEAVSDALAIQNEQFRALDQYMTDLETLVNKLQGNSLNASESADLDRFIERSPWVDELTSELAAELKQNPGKERKKVIFHILEKINKEATNG